MAKPVASDAVLQAAAEWFAVMRAHGASESDKQHWQAWLEADPDHRAAWQYIEMISARFAPVRREHADTAAAILHDNKTRQRQRRRLMQGVLAFAGVSLTGASLWRYTTLPVAVATWRADYRTTIGERREIVLEDNGRIWLNTATAMNTDYQATLRKVELVAGEIMVTTAADHAAIERPFVVESAHGRMRALGTQFTVRLLEERTYLAVYQGAVEVTTANGQVKVIHAGTQTTFDWHSIEEPTVAQRARKAWASGVLVSDDMTLQAFAAELNRYWRGHLSVADDVQDIRIFGGYPLDDMDHALAMLTKVAPVTVRKTMPWWVTIEAKPAPAESAKQDPSSALEGHHAQAVKRLKEK